MELDFADRFDVDGGDGREGEDVVQGTGVERGTETVDRNAGHGAGDARVGLGGAGAAREED